MLFGIQTKGSISHLNGNILEVVIKRVKLKIDLMLNFDFKN